MSRVTVGVARQRALTVLWPWSTSVQNWIVVLHWKPYCLHLSKFRLLIDCSLYPVRKYIIHECHYCRWSNYTVYVSIYSVCLTIVRSKLHNFIFLIGHVYLIFYLIFRSFFFCRPIKFLDCSWYLIKERRSWRHGSEKRAEPMKSSEMTAFCALKNGAKIIVFKRNQS